MTLVCERLFFFHFTINRQKGKQMFFVVYFGFRLETKSLVKKGTVKFVYSEKATKFCEISTNYLSCVLTASQITVGDFAKCCGLLRIDEL